MVVSAMVGREEGRHIPREVRSGRRADDEEESKRPGLGIGRVGEGGVGSVAMSDECLTIVPG